MTSALLRVSFLFSFFFSLNAVAQESTPCVSHKDLSKISKKFNQFKKYVGTQAEYCEAEIPEKWLKIANSLVVLIRTTPNEPNFDAADAFTHKAISENNWWTYFTNRASRFAIQNNCPEGVVAYVRPFFGNGTINLCDFFFEESVSSQASTLMHEVRHFDGHGHVECTQGNEIGQGGACDNKLSGKGSYAVSVQTLVGMARSTDTLKSEKPSLEAEAVYMAFNKFNKVPKVKINKSILLSNAQSEVYQWTLGKGAKRIAKLQEPSIVAKSGPFYTIYPLDTNKEAYRKGANFKDDIENPGLYAKLYNSDTPEERENYKIISYGGAGGILKGNSLVTLCDFESLELGEDSLDDKGQFTTIIRMSLDSTDQMKESFLLADNGDLYRYKCATRDSTEVEFEMTDMKLADSDVKIVNSFGLGGKQFALLDDGSLSTLSNTADVFSIESVKLPIKNADWVSASPMSQAEIFNQ